MPLCGGKLDDWLYRKSRMMKIDITDIEGFKIGQAENTEAGTGCTVILAEDDMAAGMDVRGGGPASRESELLKPMAAAQRIHAVLIGGGSAFGLGAADGVLQYLEERGIGYDVGVTKVPLVCQSNLFDLTVGDFSVRPDKQMAYTACENAQNGNYRDGNYGAGCGATVGKWLVMDYCMKSGIGSAAMQVGDFKIGAIVAVNSLGDIFDPEDGTKIAGLLSEDKRSFRSTEEMLYQMSEAVENKFTGNTTIGAILMNADIDKTRLCKIASMTHNGFARCIRPVHTSADGDSIYGYYDFIKYNKGVTTMTKAIVSAVKSAVTAYGFLAYSDLKLV